MEKKNLGIKNKWTGKKEGGELLEKRGGWPEGGKSDKWEKGEWHGKKIDKYKKVFGKEKKRNWWENMQRKKSCKKKDADEK